MSQPTFLLKNSSEIAKNSTEMLHFAANFSVQSRSLATNFRCNFIILYSRVIKPVQLTSLSAAKNLTYLLESGLVHKCAVKNPLNVIK